MKIPDSARVLLESNALAHLVTLNPDGSPQVTIVWVGLEGDEIVAAHLHKQQKMSDHGASDNVKEKDMKNDEQGRQRVGRYSSNLN